MYQQFSFSLSVNANSEGMTRSAYWGGLGRLHGSGLISKISCKSKIPKYSH